MEENTKVTGTEACENYTSKSTNNISAEQIKRLTCTFECTARCKLMAVMSTNIRVTETRHTKSSNNLQIFLFYVTIFAQFYKLNPKGNYKTTWEYNSYIKEFILPIKKTLNLINSYKCTHKDFTATLHNKNKHKKTTLLIVIG